MKLGVISFRVLSLFVSLVAADSGSEVDAPASQDEFDTTSSETIIKPEDIIIESASSQEDQGQETSDSYFPWTHKPICGEALSESGDQFCIYTNASFSNGRGISILTTVAVAEEFAALPLFQDATALSSKGINVDTAADERPWYTAALPGKGIGMLASRPLQRGDLITAYTPSLLAHVGDSLFTEERERLLRLGLDQLPSTSREAYLALAKFYDEPDVVAQDVLKANGFDMQVGGLKHGAVFPEASRYNHACGPNAQYFFSADLLTHYVHAVRPIGKDEEITISYAPPLRLHAERQEYFQSVFRFKCACPRCSPGSHSKERTIEDSDRATQEIINLQYQLSQWTPGSTATVKKAEQLVNLYKAEGLEGFMDLAYGHAALTYNGVGSARGAKKYANLAVEATRLKYGFDAVGLQKAGEWEKFASDPMSHATWRKRKTT
ncbi:uncharacterized protein A1O9_04771 [Exophiala aquamarina CBS 119918]|uniref:SET domain-containing protein n=1 Tax=Exophiala aquamarina CBS 119918 TaxID=1182545 RepID=A0A072PKR1_9EURO|nr:uncharacterized protein A1O9_04771 [Exophiala aquamarina CBS 119918]KEF59923.1 hypothetical protein A1O9_04771 [Exophiala aquamarina CBS 119918]